MSYDPDRSASQDFGEHHLHIINKQEFYPPDFEIGYQHFKSYRHCFYCGNQDHESNLILCDDKQWRHPCCDKQLKEINENFKNKKP
jgi:hypothetical protein